jgi:subtilisin family serine protease
MRFLISFFFCFHLYAEQINLDTQKHINQYFTNFGKQIKIENHLKILPYVIIKTKLSKEELKQKLHKPLQQIAFLKDANLFLVKSDDALKESKNLAQKEYILYAQPDMIQQRIHTKYFSKQDIAQTYGLNDIWKQTKGKGVKIAIIDDGFNLEHEDLKETSIAFSYDADQKSLNAAPKLNIDRHGTQVAGIIFAAHNGIGIDGIAPEAQLIAIRQTTNKTSDTIIAFTVARKAGADIINCSWNSPILLEPVYDVIVDIIKNAKKARGTAVVFAAGNDAKELKPFSTEASIDEVITVGSFKKQSNWGGKLDFKLKSGIMTTKGGSYGIFGGTSAVAPVISGLLALEMALYPNKTVEAVLKELQERYPIEKGK